MNKRKVLFMVIFVVFCVFTSYQSLLAVEKNSQARNNEKSPY